ncbi:HAD family hydrolase [Mycobacterium simiae]|uniref:HAD family hydrolase n=1 Tax=Mycobacterium simiae TaxID=1784 RepID=A0A5B1BVI7_MYCSI|nr:HAD family hydrolase [Mycobacterium simiae]KAA1251992.1 HAD family hydrolase [Mycobacterium simiae]
MLTAAATIANCRAVVFDCAGTLLRLDPSPEQIFQDAAGELGLDIALLEITRAYEVVNFAMQMKSSELTSKAKKDAYYAAFNRALCTVLGIDRSFDRLHPLLLSRFTARRRWVAFDDAAPALTAVGAHVDVHALANWDKHLEDVLVRAGLRHLVGDAASSELLGAEKPARACFDAFLDRNGLDADQVVYVGNEYVADVVGAREAGLKPILVDRDDRLPYADCLRVQNLLDLTPPDDARLRG